MNKRPAFLFYPGDFLKDPGLSTLNYHHIGVFVKLLCYAHQTDGELRYCEGGDPFTISDLAQTLGLEADETQKVIDTLIRRGCLKKRDDDGCLYNARMVRDCKEAQEYHENRKRASLIGVAARQKNKQPNVVPMVEPNVQPNVVPMVEPNNNQRLNQKATLSSSSSITSSIDNNFNKKGKMNLSPGTMPTNEQEAVDFCMGSQVPEWFIRKKAYTAAVAEGFKTAAGNMIASWPQWVLNYWNNYQGKHQNDKKAVRAPQYENGKIQLKSLNDEEPREVIHLKQLN